MLRECHRILKPEGRLGGYLIHHVDGLDAIRRDRAAALGPSEAALPLPLQALVRAAGFRPLVLSDVSQVFRETAEAFWRERRRRARTLKIEEGEEQFAEQQERKRQLMAGIDEGLLARSLIVAAKGKSRPRAPVARARGIQPP